jgi:hypothetical protein
LGMAQAEWIGATVCNCDLDAGHRRCLTLERRDAHGEVIGELPGVTGAQCCTIDAR